MANSATNLDTISSSQASKEITANALYDAMSMASVYGRRASTTSALTWGYYGGNVTTADSTMVQVANGTVALTASTTNYLVALKSTGGVSVSTSSANWNNRSAYWRLYSIVTGASTVASYTDAREPASYLGGSVTMYGVFVKSDPMTVAFMKTGADTATVKAGTRVNVGNTEVAFASDTAISMPTLVAGTDYAIWLKDDATIQATTDFAAPPGAGNWRKIGGFHYAPGGNAAAQAGGDTTPAINAYSFWDLKFRPACPDPRGMTLVADAFWADIYLLGVDHLVNGTSKYNVIIASGATPPKIPTKFGGDGSAAYSTMTWWEANEVLRSWGKRPPRYDEFAALAYGTTEASSGGTNPVSTILRSAYTSAWGVMLASGNGWVWGAEFGGPYAAASWTANTGGRGSTYRLSNVVLYGGDWTISADSGSRASLWANAPTLSVANDVARGVCDHVNNY